MSLHVTFGQPISDYAPLLQQIESLVGKPVRVLVTGPDGKQRLCGTLLRADREELPELLGHSVRITLDHQGARKQTEIATDRPGTASWDSPGHRQLTIALEDERTWEISDAREIRRLDDFEDALQHALQLDDPFKRHERLETLVAAVWDASRQAQDPELRMRLFGLSLFLTEYWPSNDSGQVS